MAYTDLENEFESLIERTSEKVPSAKEKLFKRCVVEELQNQLRHAGGEWKAMFQPRG